MMFITTKNLEDKFINFFKSINFNFTPEAMSINWNDVDKTLHIKKLCRKNKLWYGMANDFEYNKNP